MGKSLTVRSGKVLCTLQWQGIALASLEFSKSKLNISVLEADGRSLCFSSNSISNEISQVVKKSLIELISGEPQRAEICILRCETDRAVP